MVPGIFHYVKAGRSGSAAHPFATRSASISSLTASMPTSRAADRSWRLLYRQPGSLPLLVPDDVEAGAAAYPQGGGAAEQGGGLHLGGQDTQALPRLPLVEQLLAHWHPLGVVLSIEGILALHHAGVPGLAQVFGSLHQGSLHLIVGHGGELDGGVLPAGPLVADRAGGDHHIVALNGQGDAAAGAHPDEGVRADVVQLLHGDHRRGAADAGGADAHLLPQKGSGIGGVLPVALYLHRVIKVGCESSRSGRDHRAGNSSGPLSPALHLI